MCYGTDDHRAIILWMCPQFVCIGIHIYAAVSYSSADSGMTAQTEEVSQFAYKDEEHCKLATMNTNKVWFTTFF